MWFSLAGNVKPVERPFSDPMLPSFLASDHFRNYDKLGGKILVKAIKCACFGSASIKMDEERMAMGSCVWMGKSLDSRVLATLINEIL
jgi:hypothetical protein